MTHWSLKLAGASALSSCCLVEAGLPPIYFLFKHARLRYAFRMACGSPATNPAIAALPPSFPFAITWRDPFTGRHAVPYPKTREWNTNPTRSFLHIDAIASLVPWPAHTFPVRDHIVLPSPLSLPSLPTKEQFDPNQVFPLSPPSPSSGTSFMTSVTPRSRCPTQAV